MKKIGIIGGMSHESTGLYYQWFCDGIKVKLGGHHSGRVIIDSVDFEEIKKCQFEGRWDDAGQVLAKSARNLESAGADLILLATNTMHKVAEHIVEAVHIPFLHLADATADRILELKFNRVSLLGTRFTMEDDFYRSRLVAKGIDVSVPNSDGIKLVHDVIYNELCHGVIKPESLAAYLQIIQTEKAKGAQAVIFGCTEITMLVKPEQSVLPVLDTTRIHIEKAIEFALA